MRSLWIGLCMTVFCQVWFVDAALANTVTLGFVPSSQPVSAGQAIDFEVLIAGIGAPPAVGAFDLTVTYNDALLSLTGVTFGSDLGNVNAFQALTSDTLLPGSVEFAEVSLLSSSALNARQPSSFALATLSFEGVGSGIASLSLETGVVDDAFGNKLVAVPEPRTGFLVVMLAGHSILVKRRRMKAAEDVGFH